ncbi:MAG TPA: hypothetical protein VMH80_28530 [Bryobacteraceae bacterium]|nr:hypothetical protein [Bryobacteraceae bacterium]
MSLSREQRLENVDLALELMLQTLGDNAIDTVIFELGSDKFTQVQPTTWKELEDRCLIKRMDAIGHPMCQFTGDGWLAAIELAPKHVKALNEERLSRLAAALKDEVKGRDEDGYVYLNSLAASSELPENWIYNAIEARLLEHWFNRKGANWYGPRGGSPLIHIPVDFGLEPL